MSHTIQVVPWGKERRAAEGEPGRPVLPGDYYAQLMGCRCAVPRAQSGGRAVVGIDSDCPVPWYPYGKIKLHWVQEGDDPWLEHL